MPLNKFNAIAMVTLFGVSLCAFTTVNADDDSREGIVRISDGTQHQSSPIGAGYGRGVTYNSNGEVQYPSPFKEWVKPSTYPVHPGFFYYERAYPDHWYGQQQRPIRSQAKVIYTPTDTTQLGYYYQHVPVWQPNASMIPPEPHPATWHNWQRLPADIVWRRRGVGYPKGRVNSAGQLIPEPDDDDQYGYHSRDDDDDDDDDDERAFTSNRHRPANKNCPAYNGTINQSHPVTGRPAVGRPTPVETPALKTPTPKKKPVNVPPVPTPAIPEAK